MICQGCWQSLPKLNQDLVDVPPMQLVGYRTSHEEIRKLFHKVHLLRRPPGLPPDGPEWMRKVTNVILSSLRSHFGQRKGPAEPEEGQRGATAFTLWPNQLTKSYFQIQGEEQPHSKPSRKPRRHINGHRRLPVC